MNWLPFQGAPFRALFVYHVRMLCHLLFGKNRAEIFLDFEHPRLKGYAEVRLILLLCKDTNLCKETNLCKDTKF